MFEHIGRKIMGLAKIVAYLGIALACLAGLFLWIAAGGFEGFLTGVIVAGLGSLLAWLGSFMVYGYGRLIENTDCLVMQQTGQEEFKGFGVDKKNFSDKETKKEFNNSKKEENSIFDAFFY